MWIGLLDKIRGKEKDMSPIVAELQAVKLEISKIPEAHPTYALVMGPGARTAREQIPLLCGSIAAAIEALQTGLIFGGTPIPKGVSRSVCAVDLLKRSASRTRDPAFVGLLSTIINPDGLAELKKCADELNRIAEKIR